MFPGKCARIVCPTGGVRTKWLEFRKKEPLQAGAWAPAFYETQSYCRCVSDTKLVSSNVQFLGQNWRILQLFYLTFTKLPVATGMGIIFSIQAKPRVSLFPDFSNFFVLVSGEVRVSRTTFKWVRHKNEAQLRGKIWFTSCFSLSPHSTCMVYPVTIKFVARKEGKEDVELASVTIMPARDSFPVDGLLGSARALWLVESWELGIRVNCKGNKINSDDEYYEPVPKGTWLLWLVWIWLVSTLQQLSLASG